MPEFTTSFSIFDKDVLIREMQLKEYKVVLKCLLGESPDHNVIIPNLFPVVKECTNLNMADIQALDFVDFFILLCSIRINSVGNMLYLSINNTDETIPTKITLNLDSVINYIIKCKEKILLEYKDRNCDGVLVNFRIPTVLELAYSDKLDYIDSSIFVSKLIVNGKDVNVAGLDLEYRRNLFDMLPAKVSSKIIRQCVDITKSLNDINMLDVLPNIDLLKSHKLPFSIKIQDFCYLVKLIFSDDLMSIYNNIYRLSRYSNISAEYLETCTPGEFQIYIKNLEAERNAQNNTGNSEDVGISNETDMDLEEEYSDVDFSKTSPSEFTG